MSGSQNPRQPRLSAGVSQRSYLERLEPRTLMAFGQLGPQFHVGEGAGPDVLMDDAGNFAIVWAGEDGDVRAQRYSAAGQALGETIPLTTTMDVGTAYTAAMNGDGRFVVAWSRGDHDDVYARRFSAAGEPLGDEFVVNAPDNGELWASAAAMDASGNFIVVWARFVRENGIVQTSWLARRFSAAGESLGDPIDLGPFGGGQLAMDRDGDFVMASVNNIQLYNNLGEPVGSADSVEGNFQFGVAMDDDGDFVFAWTGFNEINARRYNAAGELQGETIQVTSQFDAYPGVAVDADGDFVVVWQRVTNPGSGADDVYARRYSAAGEPLGDEFRVNMPIDDLVEGIPHVNMDADGDFVVVWPAFNEPQQKTGIYARRYGATQDPPRLAELFVAGSSWTASFRNFLQSRGLGEEQFGYAVPGGAAGLQALPWVNLDRISMRFNQDVRVTRADLVMRGFNVVEYPVAEFSYDPSSCIATWTLGRSIGNDRVTLSLNAGVTGAAASIPLNVLPADVNRSGAVLADDFSAVKTKFFTRPGDAGYGIFHDVDGSGSIVANDFSLVKSRFFNTLPSTLPPAEEPLFGARPIRSAVLLRLEEEPAI